MFQKYQTKVQQVHAWQIRGSEAPGELAQGVIDGLIKYCEDGSILVKTPCGEMQGFVGDYIIKAKDGYHVCHKDVFDKTYDKVE